MAENYSASKRNMWRASVGLMAAHSLVWGLRLLPDGVFLAVVGAERILFLQGPSLALAQRTLPFFGLYVVGMATSILLLNRALQAKRRSASAGLLFCFAILWCFWGVLASAPII